MKWELRLHLAVTHVLWLPGTECKNQINADVGVCMHTHIVHREGTSVSPDPFMLSAGPNPKSVSKAQVKGRDCVLFVERWSLSCGDFGGKRSFHSFLSFCSYFVQHGPVLDLQTLWSHTWVRVLAVYITPQLTGAGVGSLASAKWVAETGRCQSAWGPVCH